MQSAPAVPRARRVFLASVAILVILFPSAAAASGLDDTTWNLTGTSTLKIGAITEAVPVTAILSLNADRTYAIADTDPTTPDEEGVWFENRGSLLLYTQNLLEQIVAIESALGTASGDTVRVSVLKGTGKAGVNSRTGLLTLQSSNQMSAFFTNMNVTLGLSVRSTLTGSQAP